MWQVRQMPNCRLIEVLSHNQISMTETLIYIYKLYNILINYINIYKKSILFCIVFPVVIYGCESWAIKKAEH